MDDLKELVNVEYPGIVKNLDRMLETIGGRKALEKSVAHQSGRLELTFRPKALHAHSVLANRLNTHNFLVKCVKKTVISASGEKTVTYETKIVGLIETTFRFSALADFQYLPMEKIEGKFVDLIHKPV